MKKKQLIQAFHAAFEAGQLVKCTLSQPASSAAPELKNVYIRPVVIKKSIQLALNHRYKTRDEVKNLELSAALQWLEAQLGTHFLSADLFTTEQEWSYNLSAKGVETLRVKTASAAKPPDLAHDRNKQRLLNPAAPWLHRLGITNAKGEVLAASQDKWRQINKYLEIIASLLKEHPLPTDAIIADMGSGKGYLTFALYDYLVHHAGMQPKVYGIELRPQLVTLCNELASENGFQGLQFVAQDIADFHTDRLDMLIALHACDTATDLALYKGIVAKAGILLAAPCCHKQIRKEMQCQTALAGILKHGILEERQAELITDGIRALILESKGYQTKVFEFISSEHTAKNVLITATRHQKPSEKRQKEALEQIQGIKKDFGIQQHHLEWLMVNG